MFSLYCRKYRKSVSAMYMHMSRNGLTLPHLILYG